MAAIGVNANPRPPVGVLAADACRQRWDFLLGSEEGQLKVANKVQAL
ncbi:hypothetical protein BURPSPAST_N0008 [Burkholderia pseudomallei Pasteur 52237]|nr:hypothetical protein BURPSPAST_N0008 [Burkholderia pseudomallei Pasteur 52237]